MHEFLIPRKGDGMGEMVRGMSEEDRKLFMREIAGYQKSVAEAEKAKRSLEIDWAKYKG